MKISRLAKICVINYPRDPPQTPFARNPPTPFEPSNYLVFHIQIMRVADSKISHSLKIVIFDVLLYFSQVKKLHILFAIIWARINRMKLLNPFLKALKPCDQRQYLHLSRSSVEAPNAGITSWSAFKKSSIVTLIFSSSTGLVRSSRLNCLFKAYETALFTTPSSSAPL